MELKVGDRVVYVGYWTPNWTGYTGTICELRSSGRAKVHFDLLDGYKYPYLKNLRPDKQYYITKFKELYGE